MSMRMRVLCRAPSLPESSCKRTKSRLTLSGTTCLKTVYAYVHWVLIQAVPFALFIDLLRLQTRLVCSILFCGLTAYAGGNNYYRNYNSIRFFLYGVAVRASLSRYTSVWQSHSLCGGDNAFTNSISMQYFILRSHSLKLRRRRGASGQFNRGCAYGRVAVA